MPALVRYQVVNEPTWVLKQDPPPGLRAANRLGPAAHRVRRSRMPGIWPNGVGGTGCAGSPLRCRHRVGG